LGLFDFGDDERVRITAPKAQDRVPDNQVSVGVVVWFAGKQQGQ